jgi:L-fuculose-phosphate aldolase
MATERELRAEMIRFSHLCYERGLLVAMDGNLSARLPDGNILCTQAGCHKGLLEDSQLVVIDSAGKKVRGAGEPTSEMAMHLACYRTRPDVQAVVHAHPPMAIAFTIAGQTLARCVLPEVVMTLGTVPTLDYATTGTVDLADSVGVAMRVHDAVLMDRHGAVCVGTTILEAFCRLETLEHTAAITKNARDLGGVRELPPEEAENLRRMGLLRYGGPPESVARAMEPGVDLPDACRGCSGCARPTDSGIAAQADLRVARLVSTMGRPPVPKGMEEAVFEEVVKALGGNG